ncbi:MAG: hypothetical protein WBO70_00625, partial [Erysipelotrichaceae bacterium]
MKNKTPVYNFFHSLKNKYRNELFIYSGIYLLFSVKNQKLNINSDNFDLSLISDDLLFNKLSIQELFNSLGDKKLFFAGIDVYNINKDDLYDAIYSNCIYNNRSFNDIITNKSILELIKRRINKDGKKYKLLFINDDIGINQLYFDSDNIIIKEKSSEISYKDMLFDLCNFKSSDNIITDYQTIAVSFPEPTNYNYLFFSQYPSKNTISNKTNDIDYLADLIEMNKNEYVDELRQLKALL